MIYLNYAALCPALAEAEQEVERTLTEFKRYLYSEAGIEWYLRKVSDCRQRVGDLLHVGDPLSIAFTTNASTAHYLLLSSLKWEPRRYHSHHDARKPFHHETASRAPTRGHPRSRGQADVP